MKALIIYKSIHHNNTLKIAQCMKDELDAKLIEPKEFASTNINDYDLIGFGSGLYGETFHQEILDIISSTPSFSGKKVFLFATAAVLRVRPHKEIKKMFSDKKAIFIGDFCCKGFNTNSFMKYFAGMNKGRPNENDLYSARKFAQSLMSNI